MTNRRRTHDNDTGGTGSTGDPFSGFTIADLMKLASAYLNSYPQWEDLRNRSSKFRADVAVVHRHLLAAAKEIDALPADVTEDQLGIFPILGEIFAHWSHLASKPLTPRGDDASRRGARRRANE